MIPKKAIFKIGILLACMMAISPIFFISADSTTISVDVFSVPPPSVITATVLSSTQITLSWDAVTDAVSYNIYRNSSLIGNTASTTYADSGLTPSTSYTYQVASVDSGSVASALSDSVTAITQSAPVSTSTSASAPVGGQTIYVSKPRTAQQPILINQGQNTSDSQQVILYLSAKGAEQMMISNNQYFNGAVWEEYKTMKVWTLQDSGQQKVYAKFKNSKGAISNVYMDMIVVNAKIDSVSLQNLMDKLNELKNSLIGVNNQTPTPEQKQIINQIDQTKQQENQFQNQTEQEDVPLVKEKTEDIIKQTQPQGFSFEKIGIGGTIAILSIVSLLIFLIRFVI